MPKRRKPTNKRMGLREAPAVLVLSETEESNRQQDLNGNEDSTHAFFRYNDETLQDLFFDHLDIEVLCEMFDVSKGFRRIARKVFAKKHQKFNFSSFEYTNIAFRRVLCKFGHLITEIDALYNIFNEGYKIDTDAIATICSTKLKVLKLENATIDCTTFQSLLIHLENLTLLKCEFVGDKNALFSNCPNLHALCFYSCEPSEYIAHEYPQLTELSYGCARPNSEFDELLSKNPQLKLIYIYDSTQDGYISSVVNYTKNLDTLWFVRHPNPPSRPRVQTKEVLLKLAELKELRTLALELEEEDVHGESIPILMAEFVKMNVPLEQFEISGLDISSNEIRAITKLKTLSNLTLGFVGGTNDQDLISLSRDLPLLRRMRLCIHCDSDTPIKWNVLTETIKAAKNLELLILSGIQEVGIGQQEFEALRKLVQNRGGHLELVITTCKNTHSRSVPEDVREASQERLILRYTDCQCDYF